MSSDPKKLDDLIPFNEVTVEKTVAGDDPPKPPQPNESTAERTYAGTELPTAPAAAPLPDYGAETPPLPGDEELIPTLSHDTNEQALPSSLDLLTPAPAQPATTFRELIQTGTHKIELNNTPPSTLLATDELTGEIHAPKKNKTDWKAIFEMARARAVEWTSVARDKAGDLVMKFQLLPPKHKKIAYAGAGVFAGVFTLALFLPRHRPAPTAHRPPRQARPPMPESVPPPIRQAQEAPPPRIEAPPTVQQAQNKPSTADVAPKEAAPAPKAVAKKEASPHAKKGSDKKAVAKKNEKADSKKSKKVAQKSGKTDSKKKDSGKSKKVAQKGGKDSKKGKSSKQAATKKNTKGRKPASKEQSRD